MTCNKCLLLGRVDPGVDPGLGLLGTTLAVDKKAVAAGTVLQAEYDELMRCVGNAQARKVRWAVGFSCAAPPTREFPCECFRCR